jgi:mono/diheme cytochrome c family protein
LECPRRSPGLGPCDRHLGRCSNVKTRIGILALALAIIVAVAASALSAGCSGTTSSPSMTPPAAVTPAPSEPASTPAASTPATPAVSGVELGKMIFMTGNDNAGVIPTKLGMPTVKVNACKNCHGENGKGGKPLAGPDIRGKTLKPDFDEAKFATAVTTGVDDAGKKLHSKMPRFSATPEDTAALWLYVNTLK